MIRVAHSADWHLHAGATLAGKLVHHASGVNLRWLDQMEAVSAYVTGAIERQCDLAVIVGDVFDKVRPGPAEIVYAQQQVRRLAHVMPTIVIPGNHDLAVGTDPSAVAALDLGMPGLHVLLRPEIVRLDRLQIAALPFPSKASILARDEYAGLGPEAVNARVSTKLRAILQGLRARLDAALPSLLIAHLIIQGAALNESQAAGQEHISLAREDLDGWSLVCLGDLHLRQQVTEWAWYSGSLYRTDFGMEHHVPGWLCHELDERGDLDSMAIATPDRQFVTLTLDELRHSDPIEGTVYRVKDRCTQEQYDALQPDLTRWRAYPLFAEALEITRETRARSEAMTGELSEEAALAAWAKAQGREGELPALIEAHRGMAGVPT